VRRLAWPAHRVMKVCPPPPPLPRGRTKHKHPPPHLASPQSRARLARDREFDLLDRRTVSDSLLLPYIAFCLPESNESQTQFCRRVFLASRHVPCLADLNHTGNKKILTHDFVHRTHMDIFWPSYYPRVFPDWSGFVVLVGPGYFFQLIFFAASMIKIITPMKQWKHPTHMTAMLPIFNDRQT